MPRSEGLALALPRIAKASGKIKTAAAVVAAFACAASAWAAVGLRDRVPAVEMSPAERVACFGRPSCREFNISYVAQRCGIRHAPSDQVYSYDMWRTVDYEGVRSSIDARGIKVITTTARCTYDVANDFVASVQTGR